MQTMQRLQSIHKQKRIIAKNERVCKELKECKNAKNAKNENTKTSKVQRM